MCFYEFLISIIALASLLFFEYKHGFSGKQIIVSLLFLVPVLFFSIDMLTDTVTVDEPQYLESITNIKMLKYSRPASKLLNQYKLTQLIVGTEFSLIPNAVKSNFSTYQKWAGYKICHWMSLFYIILLIVHCFDKWLVKSEKNRFFMDIGVLCTLIGLPVSCLLLKVCNYDAFGAYFIILGYVLLLSGAKHENDKLYYLSVLATALGVMEKGANLPYWLLCIVLICFYKIKESNSWKKRIINGVLASFLCVFVSVFSSLVYFLITYVLQDGFYTKITKDIVLRSFVGTFNNFGGIPVTPVRMLGLMTIAFPILSLILYSIVKILNDRYREIEKIMMYIDSFLLILLILVGIAGAYFVYPMKSYAFPIKEGYYIPGSVGFKASSSHYGARTFIGHIFYKFCYSCGVLISNYPVVVIALFVGLMAICVKKLYDKRAFDGALLIGALISILLLFIFLDCPVDGRYYAVPLIMMVIISVYLCGLYFPAVDRASFMRIASWFLIYCVEMMLFIPNVKVFSPMWLWHSNEFNAEVRTGMQHVGGVYLWGEEISICGRQIDRIVTREEKYKPEDIKIYAHYGCIWPSNPGYNIVPKDSMIENGERILDYTFDDKSYYVLNQFKLYRGDIPGFIYDVEPLYALSYKGEIGVWVYRGDQLKDYKDWFESYY